MCAYSEQVERLQGVAPQQMHVITGDGEHARLQAHRLLRLLPRAEGPLRRARRARPRHPGDHHLSRSRRPLRHLPLDRRRARTVAAPTTTSPSSPACAATRPASSPTSASRTRGALGHPARGHDGQRHGRHERRAPPSPGRAPGAQRRPAALPLRAAPARAARSPRSRSHLAAARLGRAARAVTRRPLLRHGGRPLRVDDEHGSGLEYLFGVIELDAAGAPHYRAFWAHPAPRRRPRSRTSSTT